MTRRVRVSANAQPSLTLNPYYKKDLLSNPIGDKYPIYIYKHLYILIWNNILRYIVVDFHFYFKIWWIDNNPFSSQKSLKLVDKFTYLGSSVSSTEKDIDTQLTKAWTAIDRLSIIWKSDLTDKMKCSFFLAAVVSILLYGCTTWTLTKRLKKQVGNYTRMLQAILNKSWRQHPTRHQLYGHLPPITKNYPS